jgi:hypothetical protein
MNKKGKLIGKVKYQKGAHPKHGLDIEELMDIRKNKKNKGKK